MTPTVPDPFADIRTARGRTAAMAGLMLISTALAYLLWYVEPLGYFLLKSLITFFAGLLGMTPAQTAFAAKSFFDSALYTSLGGMVTNLITFFLPFYIYAKHIRKQSFDEVCPLCGGKPLRLMLCLCVFAALQLCSTASSVLCETVGGFVFPELFADFPIEESVRLGVPELVVEFVSLCVFTPLMEEFVFRGVIFASLRPFGASYAVVVSALLFGLAHGGPSAMAYALASGLILAVVREVTGSVKSGIFLHGFNNTISFLFSSVLPFYADDFLIDGLYYLWNLVIGLLAFIGLVALFYRLEQKKKLDEEAAAEADENAAVAPGAQTVVPLRAFFSVPTVLYMLLFLYNTVLILQYGY